MRAVLSVDAPRGPGYGVVTVYDAGELAEPVFVLWRMSDNTSLAEGGWREGSQTLSILDWNSNGECSQVHVGPDVINNMEEPDSYEFEITGLGRCPLQVAEMLQSRIVDDNGGDFGAPPPTTPLPQPPVKDLDEIIHQGVEKTPADEPIYAGAAVEMSQGVAGQPAPPRKRGCLALSIVLMIFWAGCGWFLWQSAMDAPAANREEGEAIFEIIPKATESGFVEQEPAPEGSQAGSTTAMPATNFNSGIAAGR